MNLNTKYDTSDKSFHSLAYIPWKIFNDKCVIDKLLEKRRVGYNEIFNQRCFSKSLKIMNQNHKQICSMFIPSEGIKTPRHLSDNIEKDSNTPYTVDDQFQTPNKSNRICSKTERKPLALDITEIEHMNPVKAFMKDSNKNEMHLNISSSFLKNEDKAQYYDKSVEKFNPDGISESVTCLYDQPDETCPEVKSRERKNFIVKEKLKPWLFECRPSYYRCKVDQDNPNIIIRERYNPEGNAETITRQSDSDDDMEISMEEEDCIPTNHADLPTKYDDIHLTMVTSPKEKNSLSVSYSNFSEFRTNFTDKLQLVVTGSEKKNNTPRTNTHLPTKCASNRQIMVTSLEENNSISENYADCDRKSERQSEISRSVSTYMEEEKIFENPSIFDESFHINEKVKFVSSLPINPLKTSCISLKFPHKAETSPLKVNKDIKIINENTVKRVKNEIINSINKENISLLYFDLFSNTQKLKRKFGDNSDKVIFDQVFVVPSKINDNLTINNENATLSSGISVMNGKVSIGSTKESVTDAKNSSLCIDNSAIDYDNSTNQTHESLVYNKEVIQFARSALPTNINGDDLCVTPANKLERPTYAQVSRNNSVSPYVPKLRQKKLGAEVKSNIKDLKYGKKEISVFETKFAESSIHCMKDLNPSVNHSDLNPVHISMIDRSSNDSAILVRKLPLHQNLSANIISGSECSISNELYLKQDNMYFLKAKIFIDVLKKKKSCFSMHYQVFAEDKNELDFTRNYMEMLAGVIDKIPVDQNNEATMRAIDKFTRKCFEIRDKANLWILDINKDLETWKNCIQQIYNIEESVKYIFRKEKQVMTLEYFQEWEEWYKIVSKIADDMILLKEIRRPTIIQFFYEVQYLFKLFIQCLLLLGVFKNSAKDASAKKM